MLQPKKRAHKKEFRGKMRGIALRGSKLTYGEFGLQSLEASWLTGNQLEAARRVIVRETKRKGRVWLKVFPHKPVTAKSAEVTRGGGKGAVDHYVAVVRPGSVVMEIGGLPDEVSLMSLKKAARKLPIKTRILEKK